MMVMVCIRSSYTIKVFADHIPISTFTLDMHYPGLEFQGLSQLATFQ